MMLFEDVSPVAKPAIQSCDDPEACLAHTLYAADPWRKLLAIPSLPGCLLSGALATTAYSKSQLALHDSQRASS